MDTFDYNLENNLRPIVATALIDALESPEDEEEKEESKTDFQKVEVFLSQFVETF